MSQADDLPINVLFFLIGSEAFIASIVALASELTCDSEWVMMSLQTDRSSPEESTKACWHVLKDWCVNVELCVCRDPELKRARHIGLKHSLHLVATWCSNAHVLPMRGEFKLPQVSLTGGHQGPVSTATFARENAKVLCRSHWKRLRAHCVLMSMCGGVFAAAACGRGFITETTNGTFWWPNMLTTSVSLFLPCVCHCCRHPLSTWLFSRKVSKRFAWYSKCFHVVEGNCSFFHFSVCNWKMFFFNLPCFETQPLCSCKRV